MSTPLKRRLAKLERTTDVDRKNNEPLDLLDLARRIAFLVEMARHGGKPLPPLLQQFAPVLERTTAKKADTAPCRAHLGKPLCSD
jgi:hypothetical protein